MDEWDFVTILRDPINRWISEYVYNTYKQGAWEKNTLPLDDYLVSNKATVTGISYVRYFSSMPSDYIGGFDEFINEAIENLRRFRVIGSVETLDNWCDSFEKYFKKKISVPHRNASPKIKVADKIRSDDSIIKKIEKLCEPDLYIYQQIVRQQIK
jgi:hypothetical protein